jgi:hypothetical protein
MQPRYLIWHFSNSTGETRGLKINYVWDRRENNFNVFDNTVTLRQQETKFMYNIVSERNLLMTGISSIKSMIERKYIRNKGVQVFH